MNDYSNLTSTPSVTGAVSFASTESKNDNINDVTHWFDDLNRGNQLPISASASTNLGPTASIEDRVNNITSFILV